MALDPVAQQLDFSLGAFQSGALEREPQGAAEKIVGLLGDDGLPYRRGVSAYLSNAGAGAAGLLWIWDGYVAAGRRTLFGTATAIYTLAVDDATPVNLGAVAQSGPVRPAAAQGYAFIPASGGTRIYAGSRKTATYNTGSVAVTQGSKIVAGTATAWAANLDAGMLIRIDSGPEYYAIASVDSNVQVTLAEAYREGTGAGLGYLATPLATPVASSLTNGTPMVAVANRIVVGQGQRLNFSTANFAQEMFDTNYHDFPGSSLVAFGVLRDVLLPFTLGGVYAISNMAYGLTDVGTGDPQQRKELVNADLIAWGHEGIAPWSGALVVPALDNVWLMDSLGAPVPIGDRILDLYLGYVRAGYRPGVGEVSNGTYLLPILNGTTWVDTLSCRLRPTHSNVSYGWTQLDGSGAQVSGFAERQSSPPKLLGSSLKAASRVLDLSGFWVPVGGTDADGTAPSFTLATVDYPTGNLVSNFVHKVRLRYALASGSVGGEYSVDGGAWQALSGTGGTAGVVTWRVNAHARNVRFRFTSSDAGALTVQSVEAFVRHSGRL